MERLKELIQRHVGVEVIVEYGCIGTNYLQILIVKDGKIITIGEFLYRIFRENMLSRDPDCPESLIEELGKEAEKYRNRERDKRPSLNYSKGILKVY